MRNWFDWRISVVLAVALALAGCATSPSGSVSTIALHDLSPLPTASTSVTPLRVAVAAIISPQGTVASYQPLLDYLGLRLNRPVELVQRRTYAEANDLVRRNEVDLAFVCTHAYVLGAREFGMELLVVPQVHGQTVYHSAIIVRDDYPARTFADLRGSVFAFTDPLSNTGYLYPNVVLKRLGQTADGFFRRSFFTYSHDRAIDAVAQGLADAAAVDSLVLDYALARDSRLRSRIRVIDRSPSFGIPPVVVGPEVRPQLKAALRDILFDMATDPLGRQALQALDFERFVPGTDDLYASVRDMEKELSP
ncbi:MAG: phosphate/phosphite/phosphonate ABC transporter substrate-binding protein [Anaerolineae bacterium]|nr:phosphate/phosphite/phosphonate ABC transporter substrate-binding protein [Anaerolineae bacterium]